MTIQKEEAKRGEERRERERRREERGGGRKEGRKEKGWSRPRKSMKPLAVVQELGITTRYSY